MLIVHNSEGPKTAFLATNEGFEFWDDEVKCGHVVFMNNRSQHRDKYESSTDSQFVDWEANNLLRQKSLAEDGVHDSNLNERSISESVNWALESDGFQQQLGVCRTEPEKGYMCANDISLYHGNVSRIQSFMDPTVLMGFAARGVLMNGKHELDERITFHNWRQRILMKAGQCIG